MRIYLQPYKKYGQIAGRASRREYWSFYLFQILVMAPLGILLIALGAMGPQTANSSSMTGVLVVVACVFGLFTLATMVPSWTCMIRRLHDRGMSGWFSLLALVPYVGGIIMMVLLALPGDVGPNKFGDDPKAIGE